MNPVVIALRDRIGCEGPLRYSDVVDVALYGQGGFYSEGGGAGQRRDFVTSPEVGALFGAVLATALDTWWEELGRPDPYVVADCGAGPGTLAVAILAAKPACASALRLLLVEKSSAFRQVHAHRPLPLVSATEMLVSGVAALGKGPLCASLPLLPECELHVVVANELLDNLAFDIVERGERSWSEVLVGSTSEGFHEVLLPASNGNRVLAEGLVPDAPVGTRIPVLVGAHVWVAEVFRHLVSGGRLVCIDYGATTKELAGRGNRWLRTYRDHQSGSNPLVGLGSHDITIDVPFDQLQPQPDMLRTQSDFLCAHGLVARVSEGESVWAREASTGSLVGLQAKSTSHEAALLCDPTGLGAFTVAEWVKR